RPSARGCSTLAANRFARAGRRWGGAPCATWPRSDSPAFTRPRARAGGPARDPPGLPPALDPAGRTAELILAADVDNPLTGPDGAAEVYGPQKGASPAEVSVLADGLRRGAAWVAGAAGAVGWRVPGSGAAGGVGFAARAALAAQSRPGIG